MRLLKLALISIVVITVVLFAISFSLPNHVRISRAINIEAPANRIDPYVRDLTEWMKWNAMLIDSSLAVEKLAPDQIKTNRLEVYAVASVKRNWAGTRWVQPNGREFESGFELIPSGQTTIVQWYFDFYFKWYRPWEKFGSIIYDKQMSPSMEKSLTQLKALVETSH